MVSTLLAAGAVSAQTAPSRVALGTMRQAGLDPADDDARPALFAKPLGDRVEQDPNPRRHDSRDKPLEVGVLVGVGLPNLLNAGVTARIARVLGVGANVGMLPETQLPVYGQATLKYQSYDAYLRVYPIAGLFFGSGIGMQTISGTMSQSFEVPYAGENGASANVGISTSAQVRVLVATPHAGYLHTFDAGFSLGVEVGAVVPLSTGKVNVQTSLPAGTPALASEAIEQEEASTMKKIGATVLPSLSMRMGWMF